MILVNSEIAALKKIVIHTPDDGIEQVTPDKALEYLYEDIVFLDKMKHEHDVFRKLLEAFIGKENVLDIQNLLADVLELHEIKLQIVDAICIFDNVSKFKEKLMNLSPKMLAYTLITGILKGNKSKQNIISPASNFIFCRDIGVVINDHLLITQAHKKARCRESLLSYFIFNNHPVFKSVNKEYKILQLSNDSEELLDNIGSDSNELSIEGGDVMTFDKDHVFIGVSERTTKYAFEKVKEMLFHKQAIKYVTSVEIPKERFCMHLDTIFTRIDENFCVAYAPLILEENILKVKTYQKGFIKPETHKSLKDLVLSFHPNMVFIPCGGGKSPYAEREQWTDGCNLFAIKPGVAVTYDRNMMTTKAIEKQGFKVIKAETLLKKIASKEININTIEKTLILIPSNELSRARGGTHCLTFPIIRE